MQPRPRSRAEIEGAGERPPAEREPAPRPGERVLFRRWEWDDATTGAEVTSVQDMTAYNDGHGGGVPDPNVWYASGERAGELRDDPWPWVRLRLDDGSEAYVKEARLEGSPGWLRPGSRWDTQTTEGG